MGRYRLRPEVRVRASEQEQALVQEPVPVDSYQEQEWMPVWVRALASVQVAEPV